MTLSQKIQIGSGKKFSLSDRDPSDKMGFDKDRSDELLEEHRRKLEEFQYSLYAKKHRAVLIVLQGMDTSGKDGVIRHVFSGVNPQGCQVTSFKEPTAEELEHDFLWRIHKAVPRKGMIGIFNRSHYEDVVIVRVHGLVPKSVWSARYEHINAFEKMLADSGVLILKFFLHISKDEQEKRLKARLDDPQKRWKSNPRDKKERKKWPAYMQAYEDALKRCHTPWAPWFVVPSDRKWARNLAVSEILVEALKKAHART